MIKPIILLIVLIFLNAVFASAEIAVISMNEAKLRKLTADGDKRARKLTKLTEQPARFLATIQVAITLAGFLQSAFAAENFAGPLVDVLEKTGIGISRSVLSTICIIVITIILAYFNLVFGELVPKRLAMKKSESMALGMSGLLYGVSKIFAPLVWLLTVSTNGVLRLIGIDPNSEDDQVTEEEIRMMLLEGNEQGTILTEENEIIQNVFEFDDISVEEICTHRREAIVLYLDDTEEEWEKTIYENRHTYYPVCGESRDDVVGVLDTKDYFRLKDKSRKNLLEKATDRPFFVPETMKANVLFEKMKQSRIYFAVIIDEYGGLSGIVTLHDLMESLVGDINDAEDEDIEPIEKLGDNKWRIEGSALIGDVEEATKTEISEDDYDTFSGYICGVIGRIPGDGEQFTCETDRLIINVKSVKNHIVGSTVVTLKPQESEE